MADAAETEALGHYEKKFANRFTTDDEEYQLYFKRPADTPPIVDDWVRGRGRDRYQDQRGHRGRGWGGGRGGGDRGWGGGGADRGWGGGGGDRGWGGEHRGQQHWQDRDRHGQGHGSGYPSGPQGGYNSRPQGYNQRSSHGHY